MLEPERAPKMARTLAHKWHPVLGSGARSASLVWHVRQAAVKDFLFFIFGLMNSFLSIDFSFLQNAEREHI